MKNVLFSLLLTVASVVGVRAQSNTLLVYGNVGYQSVSGGGSTITNYNFSPGIGYQWNDHWTGGVNLRLSGSKSTDNSKGVSVGPFIRYTQPLAGIFVVYGQLNTNYLSGSTNTTNLNGFSTTLFPAIGMNLKNSFALNFTFGSLSFSSYKFNAMADNVTSFNVSFGSGASFGISKNFGLRKK